MGVAATRVLAERGHRVVAIGGPHEEIVAALRSEHATVVELDGAEAPDLFPGLAPHHGQPARWQPAAGVLAARDCLLVQADLAARAGAEIASDAAFAVEPAGDRVVVRTRLRRIEADAAVIATGPWLNDLLQPLGLEVPLQAMMSQASLFRG